MKKSLLTLVMALFASVMLMAQVTTSALSGIVTDDLGPVIGVTVQAIHVPSGTRYGTITNEKGAYAIRGMRVGGPYEVIISYVGAKTQKFENVTLELGETFNLNTKLSEDTDLLEEVVVVGTGSKFNSVKTGATTNINLSQIENMPTVNRSLTDFTRLSPYGGNGMSFAGTDGRTANFTVDGASFNNDFGLSSNLPGGGNPISIDAIQELQVVVSPYDVRQTDFVGGGINAITKSGTNTFKGTAYVYHKNENMQGDAVRGQQFSGARDKNRETTYGFTLGGPIIKDRLFFFANFEQIKKPTVVNRWRASTDGQMDATNYVSRTTEADMKTVSDFVKSKYGYDTGSYTNYPADEENTKFLIRLDWNITSNHHVAVRYNYTKNNIWNNPNASSMDGGTRMSGARMGQYSMAFANTLYSMENLVHSWSFDVNSRFTDNLSNQFIATYSKKDDIRGSNSSEFPHIDIKKPYNGNDQIYMALGYELFTWNNGVHDKVFNVKDDVTYFLGAHKLTAGVKYEYKMADNAYMRNGTGYYRYNTLEDFLNGATPDVVALTYGYDGETNPAARVQQHTVGFYLQDEWNVNEKFNLTAGVRFDGLFFDEGDLMTNKAIYDLTYYTNDGKERHVDTGRWPDMHVTISPRVGFTYDVFGDRSLKLRGGTGLFQGNLPLVFFTNMPTNSGMVQYQAAITASEAAKRGFSMDAFSGGLVTDSEGKPTINALRDKLISLGYPATIKPEDGTKPSSICGVDTKFKLPQVWKTSLAVDYQFPVDFPLSLTVEGIYHKAINLVSISDWAIPSVGGFARFNGVDNRPIYPAGFRTNTKAFILENTSRGYGWSFSSTLNASPAEWIDLMVAYTHTANKEVTGMPGSAAESAFTYVPTYEGPNNIPVHNSQYVTPDRVVASATINDKSGNHYSFIYEASRGGYNYSYMMLNDMNGDGYNYDAIYIPTDEEAKNGQMRFVTDDDRDRFMAYVHEDSYLKSHQGQYSEAYSIYTPWLHRVDFSYKHDFKFKVAGQKNMITLSTDIKNVMNLFNNKWGVAKWLNPEIGTEARILKYEGVDADGYATFSTPDIINGETETFTPNYSLGQCWYMSIGIKYTFN